MVVRRNACYYFYPVLFDRLNRPANTPDLEEGTLVRVVHKHGCPPPNTMGMCYIEDPETGRFHGMVMTNSLTKERS